jgi:hypothetical protein
MAVPNDFPCLGGHGRQSQQQERVWAIHDTQMRSGSARIRLIKRSPAEN